MGISDWLTPTASAVGASAVAYIGYRQSVKVERSKLEADAWSRAKSIYEAGMAEFEDRLSRLKSDLETVRADKDHVRAELDEERAKNVQLEAQMRRAVAQVEQMEQVIGRMRRQLQIAGIELDEPGPA